MKSDIAVVIPTIGRPELTRALTSVLAQSTSPDEVIVVDNSPDVEATRRLVEQQAAHATVLSLPPRCGPGIARNIGAWHARTAYVAFLDDDDEYLPDYLEVMQDRIDESSPDALYGSVQFIDGTGRTRRWRRLSDVPRESWLQRLYTHNNPGFGGPNLVARRETFFAVGGFPVDLRTGQDRGFAIAALRAGCDLRFVPDAVVRYHDSEGYRAWRDPSRYQTYLKITTDNWDDMTWPTRLHASLRCVRAFLGFVYRRWRSSRSHCEGDGGCLSCQGGWPRCPPLV